MKLDSGLDSDKEIRIFWYYVWGIPNINLFNREIRSKVITEMKNFQNIITLETDSQKVNFVAFLTYLNKNYLSDRARYPYHDWEQFSALKPIKFFGFDAKPSKKTK